jgi:phosphoesterase RecJ-like protein
MSNIVDYKGAWQMMLRADTLALVSHLGPDGDTLGSTLALGEALRNAGKNVMLFVDDDIPKSFSFMPGVEAYRVPHEEEKVACDLTVVIDASSKDRMGAAEFSLSAPILNIDHHISNTHYADTLLLDPKAAATGEIIYNLFRANKVALTDSMALNLYTAIVTDCGFFKYANTTKKCMEAAADLLQYNIQPNEVSDLLEMKSRETIELLSKVLPTMTFYAEGKISTMEIPYELYNKNIATDSFIYYPRYIDGVEAAVMFKQVEPNQTRVSMRSRHVDVSAVALKFGGGGHAKAAGCTIGAPLEEAKKRLLNELFKTLEADA